ncbi:MAG: M48 family metallopeptidase [Anaeroplasmataceae bacterium]|nr:M48 family metallopeptidase [Anaeroplasmataceae bacterium]MDE7384275.1 M48 family metallopeptidase [Anaeroplasmataceae bacterium]
MILVNVNSINFKVEVIYRRSNRKIYLRIKNGMIVITTPVQLSYDKISDMIKKNFNYIMKYMNAPIEIEDKIHYLGKIYPLHIIESTTNEIYVLDDEIKVYSKSPQAIGELVEELYKNTLSNVVERYSKDILFQFNISFDVKFHYKKAKGYYGECFSNKRIIVLSTRLAKYDLKYILSVIYHECAHFKYQNHQKEFYEYLEERYPNYRSVQRELRKIRYNEKY